MSRAPSTSTTSALGIATMTTRRRVIAPPLGWAHLSHSRPLAAMTIAPKILPVPALFPGSLGQGLMAGLGVGVYTKLQVVAERRGRRRLGLVEHGRVSRRSIFP